MRHDWHKHAPEFYRATHNYFDRKGSLGEVLDVARRFPPEAVQSLREMAIRQKESPHYGYYWKMYDDFANELEKLMKRRRRKNPRLTKNFRRERIWSTRKRGGKADSRSFRMKKLKHGGRALFACPKGHWSPRLKRCKSKMKLYELLIPRGSRRSRSVH